MTEPQSWPKLQHLYHEVLAKPASEREAFLAGACGSDADLLREVRSLLVHAAEARQLLGQPAGAAETQPLAVLPGLRLGPYEITGPLGAGGMGEVYRARDTRLDRDVAVKVLRGQVAKDPEAVARFQREARAVARLSHPHVCALFDVGRQDETDYLVLELLEGETLARRLERGALPLDEALRHAIAIAEALEAAHARGIVHRDLKPANVMITKTSGVKVMDFGLAKATHADMPADLRAAMAAVASGETRAGLILGTAAYMSPEQARGEPVDERADIWAFGCLLYEALTGRRAFDTQAAVLESEPDWDSLPAETPEGVCRLLRRCLRKDGDHRLHHIADARVELEEALEAPPEAAPPGPGVGSSRTARRPYLWMALTAGLALALGAALLPDPPEDAVGTRTTRTQLPLARAPLTPPYDLQVAIAPDGSAIAYTDVDLYVRRLDELEARPIDGTAPATAPFFSPDSRWVGLVSRSQGLKVPITGGAPVALWERGGGGHGGVSWSASGTIVFGGRGTWGGLKQLLPGAEKPEVLSVPDLDRGHFLHRWPRMLPGDEAVLLTVGRAEMESWDEASIAVLRRRSGELRIVLEGGSQAAYSPTGHLVYIHGGRLLAVPFDLADLRVSETPVPVVEGVSRATGFGLSDDGTLVYAPSASTGPPSPLLLVDRSGTTMRILGDGVEYHHPRFSPGGERLAFVTAEAMHDVRVLDLVRGAETAITSRWINNGPRWTPDGRYVLFQSIRSGQWNSHRRLADGSGDVEHVLDTPSHISRRVGEASGVVLWQETPGPDVGSGMDLMLRSPRDGAPLRPFLATPAFEIGAELSPDGAWVVYQSDQSGRFEVYLRPFPEGAGRFLVSTGGGHQPRWSRGGREIVYLEGDRVTAVDVRLDRGSPELGPPRPLFERPIGRLYGQRDYDVAPDGQSFVIVERSEPTSIADHLVLVQNFDEELKRVVPVASPP